MRKVLILSPHFPPSTLAGVHRARHLAKHLPAFGWEPTILRADENTYTEAADPALAALVPDTVKQIRTGALPAKYTRKLGIGDIGLRAFPHFSRALDEALRDEQPDAVMITGSPFYPLLLARHIKKKSSVPVVLDLQDPWVSKAGAVRPKWSKGGLSHRLAVALEPLAVRHADFITSVSDGQNEEMAERYEWMDAEKMAGIPIGGDPEDFVALRQSPPENVTVRLDPDAINLCYVGTFLPHAGPVVRTLFDAAAQLRDTAPELAKKIRFVFVGTSNQPAGTASSSVKHLVSPIAADAGIADLVIEHPPRVAFLEALSLLANADGLMLIGSDEPHYTASKIYPALMSGTPYLSIFHDRSSAHEILSSAGGGVNVSFSSKETLPDSLPKLVEGLERLVRSPVTLGKAQADAYAPYTAKSVAGQFANVFESLVQ